MVKAEKVNAQRIDIFSCNSGFAIFAPVGISLQFA